jgi:hypothetical protein
VIEAALDVGVEHIFRREDDLLKERLNGIVAGASRTEAVAVRLEVG